MDELPKAIHKKALSVAELTQCIGICRQKVMELLTSGQIGSIRVGNRWLIPVTEIDNFLQKKTSGGF